MVSEDDQNDDAEQLKHFTKMSKQDDGSCAWAQLPPNGVAAIPFHI